MGRMTFLGSARMLKGATFGLAMAAGVFLTQAGAEAAAKTALTVGMAVEPSGLDPTIATPVAIGQVTWQTVFEGLTTIDKAGKVQPQLAESWQISADGLTYTFKLRQGVTFHNG